MLALPHGSALLRRGARRGIVSAWRQRVPSTSAVLFACLLTLLQLLVLSSFGAQAARALLVARGDLYLEVLPGTDDADIQELYGDLRKLPYVAAVEYVPKDKAYERQKARNPDVVAVLERYKLANPYPDSFSVTLTSLTRYKDLVEFIRRDRWSDVIDPSLLSAATTQENDVRSLLRIADAVRSFSWVLTLLSLLCITVCVAELIARRARSRGGELSLELLLGGTTERVLIPYVTEVSVLLLLGLFAGTVLAAAVLILIPILASEVAIHPSFAPLRAAFVRLLLTAGPIVLLLEICLLPVLAYAGTWWGMRGVRTAV